MRRLVIACTAATLAACADIPSGPVGTTDFDAALQRWQHAAVDAYRYDVQVSCFCGDQRTRPVTVVVVNGQTVSLEYADSLTPADTILFSDVRTMDRLFDRLRSILDRHPALFAATYDPTFGYPLAVTVDPDAQIVDEEVAYYVSNFYRLLPASPPVESSGGPRPF